MPSSFRKNDVAAFAVAAAFMSVAVCGWLLIAVGSVLFFSVGQVFLQYDSSTLYVLAIYALLLAWLPIATFLALWERFQALLAVALIVVVAVMLMSALRLGGLALRALGFGGGIPISLVANVRDAQGAARAIRFDGCLALWTGAQVTVLRPLHPGPQRLPCHFNPRTPTNADGQPIATSLDTINRTDVLDVFFVGKQ